MSKKIQIRAYLNNNFGDDLFVKLICDRYPNEKFIVLGDSGNDRNLKDIANLNYIKTDSLFFKVINSICTRWQKLTNTYKGNYRNLFFINLFSRFCKDNIFIVGSFFVETDRWDHMFDEPWYKSHPYIIDCNFGPYTSEDYYKEHKRCFSMCKQVSFRDIKSYNLFSDLPCALYAPDVVYNLDSSDLQDDGYYLISVMDFANTAKSKEANSYHDSYKAKLLEVVSKLVGMQKQVKLLALCEEQGDYKIAKEIEDSLNSPYIESINYKDIGLDATIKLFKNSHYIIGTRFHSIVLAILFKKDFYPIIYSNKTENMLADIEFTGKSSRLSQVSNTLADDMLSNSFNIPCDNLSEYIKASSLHFTKLDEELNLIK